MIDEKNLSTKISVIGSGMWGTTIAIMLSEKGYKVNLWARSKNVYEDMLKNRQNTKYTGDILIPENVVFFLKGRDDVLLDGADIAVFAVPSHALRQVCSYFKPFFNKNSERLKAVVNAAKGFETGTNMRLSEVIGQCLPFLDKKIAVISGPNIAGELLEKLPGVSVIAAENKELLPYLQIIFSCPYFRTYTNTDLAGVEISAAVKNIIAIASGISDGLGYGTNSKASLITRGLYELSRIAKVYGANPETLSGVAGMGDLITTCVSKASRNRRVGERLAKGEKIEDIKKDMYMVAEGINTTRAVFEIAKSRNIELPITEAVYNIIYQGADPLNEVKNLMARKFKAEV